MIEAHVVRLNVYVKNLDKKRIKKDGKGNEYITLMIGKKRIDPENPLGPTDPTLYAYMEQTADERQSGVDKKYCGRGWELVFNK